MASKVALHKCFNPDCVIKTTNIYYCCKQCSNSTNAKGNRRMPITVHRAIIGRRKTGGRQNGVDII